MTKDHYVRSVWIGGKDTMFQRLSPLRFVLIESGIDGAEFYKKVVSRKKVLDMLISPANVGLLQFKCAKVLHDKLFAFCLHICQ